MDLGRCVASRDPGGRRGWSDRRDGCPVRDRGGHISDPQRLLGISPRGATTNTSSQQGSQIHVRAARRDPARPGSNARAADAGNHRGASARNPPAGARASRVRPEVAVHLAGDHEPHRRNGPRGISRTCPRVHLAPARRTLRVSTPLAPRRPRDVGYPVHDAHRDGVRCDPPPASALSHHHRLSLVPGGCHGTDSADQARRLARDPRRHSPADGTQLSVHRVLASYPACLRAWFPFRNHVV